VHPGRSFLPPDPAGKYGKYREHGSSIPARNFPDAFRTDPAGKHWKLLESNGKNPGNSRPEYCFQLPSIFRCKLANSRRTSFTWALTKESS